MSTALFDPWRGCTAMMDVAGGSVASPAALAALRAQRLKALLATARRSPLYGAILGDRPASSLRLADLPIMHKDEWMPRFDEWVTAPRLKLAEVRAFMDDPRRIGEPLQGRWMAWESSGSHGEPGVFVQDAAALAVYDALEFLRRKAPSPLRWLRDPWGLAEEKVFIGATDGHFASTSSIERLKRLNPVMAGTVHSLSFMLPVAALRDRLHAIRPTLIATYPSVAVMLAEERLAGRLDITPREVWTGGETLTPAMRAMIAQAFACKVINSYGASEFISLASECVQGRLHLNSDWAILEPVDEAGRPVPEGELGATTLLTNLANHVQPLIRYDLGDRVGIDAVRCACGSNLPAISVEGRCGDVVYLGRRGGPRTKVAALALESVIETVKALTDFQLIQLAPDELELRTALQLPSTPALLDRASTALQAFLSSQGAPAIGIRCESGRPSRRTRSGKVRRVIALRGAGLAPTGMGRGE